MARVTPDPRALQRLLDEQAVRDLASRYCWALDTGDDALLATVFLPDATASLGGGEQVGFEQIRRRIRDVLGPLDATHHVVGSHDVTIEGDTAHSRCYVLAQHIRRAAVDGPHFLVAGIYDDHCIRTGDGWRIARRVLQPVWTEGNQDVLRSGPGPRRADRRQADAPKRPTDDALWRSVEDTLRDVVVPALPEGWARQAAVQLVALAAHARTRPANPQRARTRELADALDSLATNAVVAPHWPRPMGDRSPAAVAQACSAALVDALGRDDMAAGEVRQRLRPLLVGHLDEDLAVSSLLLPAYRGTLV